jgi:hypothetical protein
MASNSMDLTSFVGKLLKEDDSDILRDGIKALAQMIMDVEVSSMTLATDMFSSLVPDQRRGMPLHS